MNSLLMAALGAWCLAQLAKVCFGILRYGASDISRLPWRLIWAGGMPSAHSAVATASTLAVFFHSGAQSLLFGLSLIMATIVIYDRSRMYAIYRQFQATYPGLKQRVENDPLLKDLVGHRLSEILVGILIGAGSGMAGHFWGP